MVGLVILGVGAAMLAQADEANQRYVECMFAAARHAPAEMPESQLETFLRGSCQSQRTALRSVTIQIQTQRGQSPAQAQAQWQQLEANGIANIVRAHEQGRRLGSNR